MAVLKHWKTRLMARYKIPLRWMAPGQKHWPPLRMMRSMLPHLIRFAAMAYSASNRAIVCTIIAMANSMDLAEKQLIANPQ
jgi:hypothetical protein